jgi:hypothetical protein
MNRILSHLLSLPSNPDLTAGISIGYSSLRPQLVRHSSELLHLLDAVLVTLMGLDPCSISLQLRELLGIHFSTSGNDRKRQQDVGGSEGSTAEILSVVRGRCEL